MAVSRIDEAGLNVNQYGNRNLVINGGMQVWQRATAATAVSNSTYGTVDRYRFWENTDGAYTAERSTDVPSGQGFTYSTKLVVTTADTSLAAGQYAQFGQRIEAQNLQRLSYGTSGAETITVSFWVKSSKTGNYAFNVYKDAAGNTAYLYYKSFSIDAANTWEKKIITVSPTAGSTSFITSSAGAIDPANTSGMELYFTLAMGSTYHGATDDSWSSNMNHYSTSSNVNWMDSTSNNFYLTGVQLEVGDTATDFEHRTFADELAKCQRYYHKIDAATAYSTLGTAALSTATISTIYPFAGFNLRSVPTLESSGVSTFLLQCNNANESVSALSINSHASKQAPICSCTHDSSTGGLAGSLIANNNAAAYIAFSSEL